MRNVATKLLTSMPGYLEAPATSGVKPPVEARIQVLPFSELSWENFERLCFRLARLDKNIEYCQIYGEKGDEQKGIDLYARKSTHDKYSVHQCKRVKNFSAAKIKKAVTKFLEEKEWVDKTDTFFLCTQESLRKKKRADEIVIQAQILKEKGITFIPRDEEELSLLLKDKPEIVDDFFGRSYVKAFCGEEAANKMGRKLDADALANLRIKCLTLYRTVFNRHDPGLPSYLSLDTAIIPFEQRYIIPDVYLDKERLFQKEIKEKLENNVEESNANSSSSSLNKQTAYVNEIKEYRQRKNVGSWLTEQDQNVILGEPGSGKSSLLRLIAIDLLSNSPKISTIVKRWGNYLPVWIPFGLWTQQTKKGNGAFKDILKAWLEYWPGGEELVPLIEQAIEEKKILLLVDGLDEWVDESAARVALNQLQVFIDLYKVPVILSSRPQGFAKLKLQKNEWSIATLSDLTVEQQEAISKIWFTNKLLSVSKDNMPAEEFIKKNADSNAILFVKDLNNNSELLNLAKNPLLLCLLLAIRFQDGHLPEDRFRAYEQIVSHFIDDHPEKRKEAALVIEEQKKLSGNDLRKTFAYLAYTIQQVNPQGIIDQLTVKDLLREYLTNQQTGIGVDSLLANEYVKNILEFGENNAGLLVKKSPDSFGFFHRTFLEFLTAEYLNGLAFSEQLKIVKKHCNNPQWKEILLSLFSLTKKQDEIKSFIETIKNKKLNLLDRCRANFLVYEIAFGNFNCPIGLAKELAKEAFDELQLKPWLPHRRELMSLIMSGLRSTKVQSEVKEKLTSWFPNRSIWRQYLYRGMHDWPFEDVTIEFLKRALYDENINNQREAGQTIAAIAKGEKAIGDYLVSVIYTDLNITTRVVALESLISGWIDHPKMDDIVSRFENSKYPIFRLLSIKGKILKNKHTPKDLRNLLSMGTWINGIDYEWRGVVEELLLRGWPKSEEVKNACFESLKYHNEPPLERETAESVLLRGYKGDSEVVEYCVSQIKYENHPFISSGFRDESWEYLADNFGNNQCIVNAVDDWLQKQTSDIVAVSAAALVGRTRIAKEKLLSFLNDHWSFWAAGALLEGWGMQDEEIAEKLTVIVEGESRAASRLGYLVPKIITDKKKARGLLLKLLKDPKCERSDFVIRGLIELGNTNGDEEVVNIVIDRIKQYPSLEFDEMLISHLIANYSFSNKVKNLAKAELKKRNGSYQSVAVGFANDAEMRGEILKLVAPIDSSLRDIIAKKLGENKRDDFSLTLLKDYDLEQNDSVKVSAAISFYRYKVESQLDVSQELKQLAKDIVCYGPDHEERRQAAFCGLVVLKRLDVMAKAKERIGDDRIAAVAIHRGLDVNLPFVNCILENWDYIKSVFGDTFISRFTKFSSVDEFWNTVAIYADSYESVSNSLMTILSANQLPPKENILYFLARVKPKSQLLLEYCLKFINSFDNPRDLHSLTHLYAVTEVVGMNFIDNDELLEKIINKMDLAYLSDSRIALIFETFPSSQIAKQLVKILRKNKTSLSQSTYFEIATRYLPAKIVLEDLSKLLNNDKVINQYVSREIYRLVIRRMKVDKEIQDLTLKHLKSKCSSSEKISFAKALSESLNTKDDFNVWRDKETESQLKSESVEIGFDLSTGGYGAVVKILFNDSLNL